MAAAMPAPCAVAVMAKASAPGRTKTRLCPPLNPQEAADLNTAFLKDIAANLSRAAERTPIAAYMAFGPPGSEAFFRENLPSGIGLIEAWLDGFGACLSHTVQALFARGHAAACVLNADSPTLPTACLVELATALAAPGDRAVIGPAEDGGYYVLGLKSPQPRLFEDIDWSTERVFEQTCARAAEIGLPLHVLPPWYDVDDAPSMRRLCEDIFHLPAAGQAMTTPSEPEHTRRLLTRMQAAGRLDLNEAAQAQGAGARER